MDIGHEWACTAPEELCDTVLGQLVPAPLIVVDGVRHVIVHQLLVERIGDFHLVFVDCPEALLLSRLPDGIDPRQHPSEADIPQLGRRADIVVDGGGPPSMMVDSILRELRPLARLEVAREPWPLHR